MPKEVPYYYGDIDGEVIYNIVFVGWCFILLGGCYAYTPTHPQVLATTNDQYEALVSTHRHTHVSHPFYLKSLNIDTYYL